MICSIRETLSPESWDGFILTKVNANMALEDQLAKDPHILDDLANEMITKNIKRIWDE